MEHVPQLRHYVHRIPHPTLETIAKRPYRGRGWRNHTPDFCFSEKRNILMQEGLTRIRKISLNGQI